MSTSQEEAFLAGQDGRETEQEEAIAERTLWWKAGTDDLHERAAVRARSRRVRVDQIAVRGDGVVFAGTAVGVTAEDRDGGW